MSSLRTFHLFASSAHAHTVYDNVPSGQDDLVKTLLPCSEETFHIMAQTTQFRPPQAVTDTADATAFTRQLHMCSGGVLRLARILMDDIHERLANECNPTKRDAFHALLDAQDDLTDRLEAEVEKHWERQVGLKNPTETAKKSAKLVHRIIRGLVEYDEDKLWRDAAVLVPKERKLQFINYAARIAVQRVLAKKIDPEDLTMLSCDVQGSVFEGAVLDAVAQGDMEVTDHSYLCGTCSPPPWACHKPRSFTIAVPRTRDVYKADLDAENILRQSRVPDVLLVPMSPRFPFSFVVVHRQNSKKAQQISFVHVTNRGRTNANGAFSFDPRLAESMKENAQVATVVVDRLFPGTQVRDFKQFLIRHDFVYFIFSSEHAMRWSCHQPERDLRQITFLACFVR